MEVEQNVIITMTMKEAMILERHLWKTMGKEKNEDYRQVLDRLFGLLPNSEGLTLEGL